MPGESAGCNFERAGPLAILGRMATHSGRKITRDEAFQSNQVPAPERHAWDADPPVLPGSDGKYPQPMPGQSDAL